MNHEAPRFPTVDVIIALLSDDEVANVNSQDLSGHTDVDEYLDLEQIDRGVQLGRGPPRPICRLLPRKAIGEATWARVIACLSSERSHAPEGSPDMVHAESERRGTRRVSVRTRE